MKPMISTLLLFVAGTAFGQDVTGDVERGEALFLSIACYSCHGFNGTGMTPLSKTTSGLLSNEAAFVAYMRLRGEKAQLYPSRQMPHYGEEVVSDEQLLDLYAYLISLDDQPPAMEDTAVLQDILEHARESEHDDPEAE